jgi:hypothetical protein
MKELLFIILALMVYGPSAREEEASNQPKYSKTDEKLQIYEDIYIDLARKHNIKFTHSVYAGFTVIKQGLIVGMCHYTSHYREIDIDQPFWEKTEEDTRRTLMFHELTHCLCGRDHDYGLNKPYIDPKYEEIVQRCMPRIPLWVNYPGYFVDGCPLSLMSPTLPTLDCIKIHGAEYEEEMFDRCKPY